MGDPVYITETRWWLGGPNSSHVVLGEALERQREHVEMGPDTFKVIVKSTAFSSCKPEFEFRMVKEFHHRTESQYRELRAAAAKRPRTRRHD
jgi:hypothetical protein